MTQTPPEQHEAEKGGPPPWHHRPFFWLLLGMLAGLLALVLVLRSCQPLPPAAEPKSDAAAEEDRKVRELVELQRAHNKGLEEEIRRLHGLLSEDPCTLAGILGASPETSPVAPSYDGGAAPGAAVPPILPPAAPSQPAPPQPVTPQPVTPQEDKARPTPAPVPGTVSRLMDEATVFILSKYQGQIGMGSGFVVAPGVIATNSHVAQGPSAEVIVGNKALGGMHQGRVIAFSLDPNRDYALVRISDDLAGKVPVLQLAQNASRTERVSAWGFPGYIAEIDPKLASLAKGDITAAPEVVYSEGVVSVVLDRNPPVILHTAALSQGNSGGPLVNEKGLVVGINTFIKIADKSYSQTNIALTAGDLARFMKEYGVAASTAANPEGGK